MLGAKQTGAIEYKVADLHRDRHLIESLPQWLKRTETMTNPSIEKMIKRWLRRTDYVKA